MTPTHTCLLAFSAFFALPAPADGQQTFTVTAQSAQVRSEPRLSSPVIGEAASGAQLPVVGTRGEWVAVSIGSSDGAVRTGYVSMTLGRLAGGGPSQTLAQPQAFDAPMATAPRTFGIGGQLGGFTFGLGANARAWTADRVGLQLGYSRFSLIPGDSGLSVNQFGAVVLSRFGEPEADDDLVFRPYAGGGINLYRTTNNLLSFIGESSTETNVGFQILGGAEVGFRNVPSVTLSGDVGYYSTSTPFDMRLGGFSYGLALHWYFR